MILTRINFTRFLFATAKNASRPQPQTSYQSFSADLKNKDVYEQYKKQTERDTILKKFRRDVFKREELSEQARAYKQDVQKQSHMMEDLLHRGSKQDIVKYSKKVMQKLVNKKKVFKDQTINPVFSDYGDYSSYRTNYLKIEDGKLGQLERLERSTLQQNLYKFIDQLPQQYEQKTLIREEIKEDFVHSNLQMSISDYGKIMQQRADEEIHSTNAKQNFYEIYRQGQQPIYRNDNDWWKQQERMPHRKDDLQNASHFPMGRLSPNAIDTMYECYLQGWTVRDISRRFGILPRRAKFFIWTRAQLYDEILPKYGWKYYYDALQSELELGEEYGYVDYGLDLDIIRSERIPDQIVEWNPDRVDAQRKPQEYTLAIKKLDKLQKFDKYQKLQVGTHGKQNKMYLMKQWTIFRGKGSDQYHLRNTTFRKFTKIHKKMVKEYY